MSFPDLPAMLCEVKASARIDNFFRSEAWVQAWIDTYGKDPRIQLIDLGGRNHPLEHVYLLKHRIKQVLPVSTLCLAGAGYGFLSSPRAEYNDLSSLIEMAGGANELRHILSPLDWQQIAVTDVDISTIALPEIEQLVDRTNWRVHAEEVEFAYAICKTNFKDYLSELGSNTRLAYFNRRKRLAQYGEIAFDEYPIERAEIFFEILNRFHIRRWGSPCYSLLSQEFIKKFSERLRDSGGNIIMQGMTLNGETVSVLLDVIFGESRYNLQSGYEEKKYPGVSLGSLHFGYAIESALVQGKKYDFMAGSGKNSSYKEKIANQKTSIRTLVIEKKFLASARCFYEKFFAFLN